MEHATLTNERPAFLTVNETCTELRVRRTKLYELIADGTIRAVRIGSRLRVPRQELDRIAREGA